MRTAKVFQNGRSQAIRLPKEFRVEGDEVYLKKIAEGFLVISRDPWKIPRGSARAFRRLYGRGPPAAAASEAEANPMTYLLDTDQGHR